MLILPFLITLVVAAPIENIPKREDAVYMTTTEQMGWAQFFGLGGNTNTVQNVAAAAATTAPVVTLNQASTAVVITSNFVAQANSVSTNAVATNAVATNTPAAIAPAAATQSSSTQGGSGGFLSSLMNFFNGNALGNGALVASASAAAATTAQATLQAPLPTATTPAASTSGSSTGRGWFANLFDSLFGISSPSVVSVSPATAIVATTQPSIMLGSSGQSATNSGNNAYTILKSSSVQPASATSDQPGFTGQVTVVGAGGDTGAAPKSSLKPKPALNSQVLTVVGYAEEGAGITYSPYTKSGQCKSASQVASDILMLLGFQIIRLYSVDCSGIQNVISAMSSSQQLYLGVWDIANISSDLPSMAQQVMTGSRGWSAVHTVAIGNEVVNSGRGTATQVANAVQAAKSWFQSNAPNYKGPVVCVDTLAAVMANPQQMCDIGDYLAVNCHPYFSGVEASTSGPWLQTQVAQLQKTCGGNRKILVTESGWPTFGNTVGLAIPSIQNQLLSIKSLGQTMGDQIIMFTMYNDYWKAPGDWNVEQHWGIFGDPSS